MGIIIDSNVLIRLERSDKDIAALISGRESEECFISVITASELLHGVHRAKESVIRARRSAFVEAMLAQIPVLPIDIAIARSHAELWATLARQGTLASVHDLWIAATCITHAYTLVTHNLKEFQRIPGLKVEEW